MNISTTNICSASLTAVERQQLVSQVLSACGNGKVLHIGLPDTELLRAFLLAGVQAYNVFPGTETDSGNAQLPGRFIEWDGADLPLDDESFSTVLITHADDAALSLKRLAVEAPRVSKRNIFLFLDSSCEPDTKEARKAWEMLFFENGVRKHPAYYRVNDYQSLQYEQGKIAIPLEKLPKEAATVYPLEALKDERDLHMDMTREPGSRSDGHIIRYLLASRYVRNGDRILDAACGLGYGAYTLFNCSDASSILGVDGSNYAVKYAEKNFSAVNSQLTFKEGWLPEALNDIPDNSIDLITSFETLEHVPDPVGLLAEFYRVLSPSGRIVLSVPNDWSDETGEDPNEFHFHVYTWERIVKELEKDFIVEAAYAQTADQYKPKINNTYEWAVGIRELYEVDPKTLIEKDPSCEWCLLVGMKSPTLGATVPYRETTYDLYPENPGWKVTRFDDYANPWLVKGLVTIGHRIEDSQKLLELSREVAAQASVTSPDLGAALCIQAYQLLQAPTLTVNQLEVFAKDADAYMNQADHSPQQLRWKVSISFVMAQLWQVAGDTDRAIDLYKTCVAYDCTQYSPTLITKQIRSYLNLGLIESGKGNNQQAALYWRTGVTSAEKALAIDWCASMGSLEKPTDFGMSELGAIVELASSCAYALRYVSNTEDRTPQWWHQHLRDRDSQLSKMPGIVAETARLNRVIMQKDAASQSAQSDWEQQFNTALSEKEQSLSLALAAAEANEQTIASLYQQLEHTTASLNQQLEQKNAIVQLLNAEVAHREQRLQTIGRSRLFRLSQAFAAQPNDLKKYLRIAYTLASLVTPAPARRLLSPTVSAVKKSLRGQPPAIVSNTDATADISEDTYIVKQPASVNAVRPRVLHVIANFMTGGSSRLVVDIYEYLGDRFEQSILTSHAPTPAAYSGITIKEIKLSADEMPFVEYLQALQPEVIHMHYWGDCDEPWYDQTMRAAQQLGIPVIQNINTPVAPYLSPVIKRYVYVSDYVRNVFGQAEAPNATVYPGSDFSMFKADAPNQTATDTIGMVYRLEMDKLNADSITPFIKAVQKRPQTRVLIVGGGSLMETFKEAVNSAGVSDNFEFTGYVAYSQLPDLYRRMKLFVAPVWKESFGQVSPFAMRMHVPVVGYDIGAIGEIVDDSSLLAPYGDADKLSDIIVDLLNDSARRTYIADRHSERAEAHFSIQAMIENYDQIYAETLAETKQ
ncbi:glycosyltransferase [Pseudomonas atacamensis]|jgi:glycosyltransferase involved in cell wall biosynthesis/ubiquinone/menaquinone biosynthesis C-methylase UbiE|uniref:glycosyltransferase n=1 Tax=Pseudomonas atacamensis TaxID=2565368 RepID=UPI00248136D0|nr:glycosyltransferase [Pseudomonas atacamensis]WGT34102.1 glycosyltransferase [Pseudomonas atacamensis]